MDADKNVLNMDQQLDLMKRLQNAVIDEAQPQLRTLVGLKPSQLIREAVADLKKIATTQQVDGVAGSVRMSQWLSLQNLHHSELTCCNVCLGGAVIGNRLNLKRFKEQVYEQRTQGRLDYSYWHFDPVALGSELMNVMFALDDFRTGDVEGGLTYLGVTRDRALMLHYQASLQDLTVVPDFEAGKPEPFYNAMEAIAALLEQNDL